MIWRVLSLVFILLPPILFVIKCSAMDGSLTTFNCSYTSGYYGNHSTYKSNLDKLLQDISIANIQNGFYNITVGSQPNRVTGIALCRGDVSVDNCQDCLKAAADNQEAKCTSGVKETIGVYEYCMLGYSDHWILGTGKAIMSPVVTACSPHAVPSGLGDKFKNSLGLLLHQLRDEAASSNEFESKYAVGYKNVTSFMYLYALAQCTPDLSKIDCHNCLDTAIQLAVATCAGVSGARVFYPSCNLRFEINRFYTQSAPVPSLKAHECDGSNSSNSAYKRNLNTLLAEMLSSQSDDTMFNYGFYNLSMGQQADQEVDGIGLCRGDINVTDCHDCIRTAINEIPQYCPDQEQVIGWYDTCMLRYSNVKILGKVEMSPPFHMCSPHQITSDWKDKFNTTLDQLLLQLRDKVISSFDSHDHKYATGHNNGPSSTGTNIYALVQCTPDLSSDSCKDCLSNAIQQAPLSCPGVDGGRVLYPSCNLRYESGQFYYNNYLEDILTPPTTLTLRPAKKGNQSRIIIIASSVATSMMFILVLVCLLWRRRTAVRRKAFDSDDDDDDIDNVAIQFNFKTIADATASFSVDNKVGEGGFGVVFKGVLSTGQEVAVKRLAKHSSQGEIEFKNEVMLLVKLQHRNLVRLLGFCVENEERLLIYDFIPKSSLDKFIFDERSQSKLDWQTRYKIIVGIARGLVYLHEDSQLRIIHCDLKASNILLDAEMSPKISDFGMARLCRVDQTHSDITTRVVGTFGYMAPEYACHGHISVKSDVYSFGVLVLEILTGRRNCATLDDGTAEDLVDKMWSSWEEGRGLSLLDSTILLESSRTEVMRCLHIGLLCVQENVAARPSMSSVILMLSSHSMSLPAPSRYLDHTHTSDR